MFFDEYNINIDPRLDEQYSRRQRKMISARYVFRVAIINWVKEYIPLDKEK
jgi:hypothetical protein